MTAEGAPTPDGYFVQAKSDDSAWTKIAGMTKAIQVRILSTGGKLINVSIGNGKWADKIGAGTVGVMIFPPLAITAAIGAWGQSKLASEIFDFIKEFLMTGGKNIEAGKFESFGVSGTKTDGSTVECPSCGAPLGAKCPSCGANVASGKKFCPECGSPMVIKKVCEKCGAELSSAQKFCPECGTPVKGLKVGDIS